MSTGNDTFIIMCRAVRDRTRYLDEYMHESDSAIIMQAKCTTICLPTTEAWKAETSSE